MLRYAKKEEGFLGKNKKRYKNVMLAVKKLFVWLIDIAYPPACPICGKPLGMAEGIRLDACIACKKKLSYIHSPRCLKCGKPISAEEKEYCFDCMKIQHVYLQGVSVWTYTDEIKSSIYRFKYKNKREYSKFYGNEIYTNCGQIIKNWNADILIPVPLHKSKLKIRGYNQSDMIATSLSTFVKIPVDNQLLSRKKKTVPQKELNDKERVKNLENAFKINHSVVKYRKVILIDDIYTTGTTIDACAAILLKEGVENVYYISLCIGKGF